MLRYVGKPLITKESVCSYERLLEILKEKNMSINKLATAVGTYPAIFRTWSKGVTGPSFQLLLRVANVLEIELSNLLDTKYADELKYNQRFGTSNS